MESLIRYSASVISLKDMNQTDGDNFYADGRTGTDNQLINLQVSIEKSNDDCLFCVFDDIKEIDREGRPQVTLAGEVKKLHERMRSVDRNVESKLNMMSECIRDTDNLLYSAALGRPANKKGTTAFAGIVFTEKKAAALNIGGNRVYLFRGGVLKQMAGDSSKLGKLLKMGIITLEQAKNISPHFGTMQEGKRDESTAYEIDSVRNGDIYLILSGWLANAFEDEKLAAILSEDSNIDSITAKLAEETIKNECKESVTALVVLIKEGCEEEPEIPQKKLRRVRSYELTPSESYPTEKNTQSNIKTYIAAVIVSLLIIGVLSGAYFVWLNGDDKSEDLLSPIEGNSEQESTKSTPAKTGSSTSDSTQTTGEGDNDAATGDKTVYTVKSGDSLSSISQKFYSDPNRYDEIMEANGIKNENNLVVGQELIIP